MNEIWFRSIGEKIKSWFTQPPSRESEDELIKLPEQLKAVLFKRIDESPSPQAYQTTIREAITPAIKSWHSSKSAANSLVILADSVESMPKIINDSLDGWEHPSIEVIRPFDRLKRPYNPRLIEKRIAKFLEPYSQVKVKNFKSSDDNKEKSLKEKRKTLVLVPHLEHCFLRSIGGWSGIEFLREIIFKNPDCFWVIGSSYSAWNFLDFVCQISAYFDQIQSLPELDDEMLADWLTPIVEPLVTLDKPDYSSNDPRQTYWDLIASQASGIARVAQYIWLESLQIHGDVVQSETGESLDFDELLTGDTEPKQKLVLHPVKPSLPSLPSLTNIDRYLLHAALIHTTITRSHLAQTLGEAESQIQARVQWLSRQGVLESHDGSLRIHPLYYDKLRFDLSNNNFFVEKN
ncbi:MarR family transcriptional regulator [Geitlerinema sp. P-1104]|uniref:MarR family transcriptional regulator n=1 Tax=Geitlerinema sp. P-1104 TaxID=2546230 RepID=UPI0014772794|nr:MarR family transcriptional regulator [Geitlerinema sp. P-1104]NMG56974.1 MarR family transcriptional regulator [Geitlerinema sp. P-1104]